MTEPAVLGAYRITGKLGDGAMGVVYEGRHDVLGRRVAIKMLRSELARDPQMAARFLNEAKAANIINHENIVNVYDVGEAPDGCPYLVMELLEGETLADRLRRGRLSPREAVRLFTPVLRALAAAHGRGIVHRDLKPANVFLTATGGVKLLDFGVAKLSAEWAQKMTKTGVLIGTPLYMSPEQIQGRTAEPRSDLFAVGVMMHEALTGEQPFKGVTVSELAAKIVHGEVEPASSVNPEVTSSLDEVLARAMAKAPDRRYATATAMMEALDQTVGGGAQATVARRRRAPLWAAVGVAAATAGGVAAAVASRSKSRAVTVITRPDAAPASNVSGERSAAEAELREALLGSDLAEVGDAMAALDAAATGRTARLVMLALGGAPEIRRQAAHLLARLGVPEAAPRVRATMEASGDRLKVELAAVLAELGDKDGLAILRQGLTTPATKLWAAVGLVAGGEGAAARPALGEIFAEAPRGRAEWSRAAAALLALGDEPARAALVEELAQVDADRALSAATILAGKGVEDGRGFLRRAVADKEHPRRAAAALALARISDREALAFVPDGLASASAEERAIAAAVVGRLGVVAQRGDVAKMAQADASRRTRLTAAAALLAFPEGT